MDSPQTLWQVLPFSLSTLFQWHGQSFPSALSSPVHLSVRILICPRLPQKIVWMALGRKLAKELGCKWKFLKQKATDEPTYAHYRLSILLSISQMPNRRSLLCQICPMQRKNLRLRWTLTPKQASIPWTRTAPGIPGGQFLAPETSAALTILTKLVKQEILQLSYWYLQECTRRGWCSIKFQEDIAKVALMFECGNRKVSLISAVTCLRLLYLGTTV